MSASDLSTFPLLKLPIEAQKHVVRMLYRLHQLTLSTFNDNTKQLVASSGITSNQFYVSLKRVTQIGIGYDDGDFIVLDFKEAFHGEYKELNQGCITARYKFGEDGYEDDVHEWNKEWLVVRDWIKHLLRVLNRIRIDAVFNSDESYRTNAILRTFKRFTVHEVQTGFYSIHIVSLLENLPPVNHVDFFLPITDEDFLKMLVQNYYALVPSELQKLTIDHLLSCNCAHLKIINQELTPKDLNRFLKIWMNSTLCTRLRYLQVNLFWPLDNSKFQQLMKNIKFKKTEGSRVFEFNREYRTVPGPSQLGIDIKRKDGTEATLVFSLDQINHMKIEMFIWS